MAGPARAVLPGPGGEVIPFGAGAAHSVAARGKRKGRSFAAPPLVFSERRSDSAARNYGDGITVTVHFMELRWELRITVTVHLITNYGDSALYSCGLKLIKCTVTVIANRKRFIV